MAYKVEMRYSDGTVEEDDEVFATEADANEHGLHLVSSYSQGGETLHLSNPGDYPQSDDEADFEIIEIEG